ncbi:hypothetical protein KUTeg_017804 [Tegillarca granosa]|uniref:AMP-binding enzyme C-terminal domain-containing protein n=1 Tax=Tegillarca granosa TaxID=220873 RepID=A0ABQ9EG03_TEGGR|nr:hypothetical protein KUTeg_017804 [Tegillarca granosa]
MISRPKSEKRETTTIVQFLELFYKLYSYSKDSKFVAKSRDRYWSEPQRNTPRCELCDFRMIKDTGWKGENVSTTEVGNILSGLEFVRDVNVYGVQVPGHDGRAGMAAIMFKEDKEVTPDMLSKLYKYCEHHLPSYARPLFIRVVKEITLTETMKHRKVEYVKEGFDPSIIQEPLYFLDRKRKTYSKLDSLSYDTVLTSKL